MIMSNLFLVRGEEEEAKRSEVEELLLGEGELLEEAEDCLLISKRQLTPSNQRRKSQLQPKNLQT